MYKYHADDGILHFDSSPKADWGEDGDDTGTEAVTCASLSSFI